MRASLTPEEMDSLARFTDELGDTFGDNGAPPFQADGSPSTTHDSRTRAESFPLREPVLTRIDFPAVNSGCE